MNEHLSVLLVEDNRELATQIIDFLTDKNFVMDYADCGKTATTQMQYCDYDMVILDLMLPDIDGYELCLQLKQQSQKHLPVLMLTARDSLSDKLKGFEVGADDYLTKPFAIEEVYMRCLALSRRVMLNQSKTIQIGELELDTGSMTASRQGQVLTLSQTDFSILTALVMAYPNAVSKRELNQKIWGDETPETDAVRSHIYTLRNSVDKPFATPIIKTVHGLGFKLDLKP